MSGVGNSASLSAYETPLWYYDMDLFRATVDEAARLSTKYGVKIHYSVKANNTPRLLAYMLEKGLGIDCVSGNEVDYSIAQGFDPSVIVFAGVGKTDNELRTGLRAGIGSFNCESVEELLRLRELAGEMGVRANVSVRINPDVDAHTHKFISTGLEMDKFGIPQREMPRVIDIIGNCPELNFKGLHFHVGSQIMDVEAVYSRECRRAAEIIRIFELKGIRVDNVDLGGGLGIDYLNPYGQAIPDFERWFRVLRDNLSLRQDQTMHVEPGRSLVAQCVSLISRVIFVKKGDARDFVVLDAGMNDLIRPALYQAWHAIDNLSAEGRREYCLYDVVGPICESADCFAEQRRLPLTLRGDLIAIRSCGAYGEVMSSSYNMRTRAGQLFSDDL